MITSPVEVKRLRKPGERWVLAVGCFDILHPGHIRYLSFAKQQGDVLVVAIQDDAMIRYHKGRDRPVMNQQARAEVVDALRAVDYTVVGEGEYETFALKMAKQLASDVVVIYHDWRAENVAILRENIAPSEVVILASEKDYSTTETLKRIRKG
jgi:rfaE bifunctional protein nucleotidyltransferase chain/domain